MAVVSITRLERPTTKNEIIVRMKSRLRRSNVTRRLSGRQGKAVHAKKCGIRKRSRREERASKNFATLATFVQRNKIFTPATRRKLALNSAVHAMREKGGFYYTLNVSRNVHEPRDRVKIQQKHSSAAVFVASGFLFRPLFFFRSRASPGITRGQQLFFFFFLLLFCFFVHDITIIDASLIEISHYTKIC